MTSPTQIPLGPFVGGLNNVSDPSAIQDTELAILKNFDVDKDGSLVTRPPIARVDIAGTSSNEPLRVIGNGSFDGVGYVFLSGKTLLGIYAYDGTTMTTVHATTRSKTAVQYAGKMWFFPSTGSTGRSWSPSGGTAAVAALPVAGAAVVYKNRLWCVPDENSYLVTPTVMSRLRWCAPTDPTTWPAINIIDVVDGDGQNLVDLKVYQDNLLLLKQKSTHVFAFDIDPADGVLQVVDDSIGATNYLCSVLFEGTVFVLYKTSVYVLNDYKYQKLNVFCEFEKDTTGNAAREEKLCMSVVGERLIIKYHNRMYCYGLRTQVFSEWASASSRIMNAGRWRILPNMNAGSTNDVYFAGSVTTTVDQNMIFKMQEVPTASFVENDAGNLQIQSIMRTKNFAFTTQQYPYLPVPSQFKKLAWWGADVLSNNLTTYGRARTVSRQFSPTWAQLSTYTWDSLRTWDNLLGGSAVIETPFLDTNALLERNFLKMLKAMRFRLIFFEIEMTTTGSSNDGPCRVFALTAIVGVKETVTKQAN